MHYRAGMRLQRGASMIAVVLCLALAVTAAASAQSNEADRIWNASNALRQIMTAEDAGVPNAVMSSVDAIAIFPSTIRGGFIFGGHRGRGIVSARDVQTGEWSLPAFLTLTGASFGLQIGGQATDIVLLIMNRRGLDRILGNQFKIGAEASVAAGPVGRSAAAATDLLLTAEILSYSRSRGLFAGVSLEGSTVRSDRDANERYYGYPYDTRDIILDRQPSPPADDVALEGWFEMLARHARQ